MHGRVCTHKEFLKSQEDNKNRHNRVPESGTGISCTNIPENSTVAIHLKRSIPENSTVAIHLSIVQ